MGVVLYRLREGDASMQPSFSGHCLLLHRSSCSFSISSDICIPEATKPKALNPKLWP